MLVQTDSGGYPKFNNYRTYGVSVAAASDLDWSANLPADPCYLLGYISPSSTGIEISSISGDTTASTLYPAGTVFNFMSPILVRKLLFLNNNTSAVNVTFLLAWN